MEATAAARGASLSMHSPQLSRQEWRAVADNHSARDAADEVGLSLYLRVSRIVPLLFVSALIGYRFFFDLLPWAYISHDEL